MAEDLSVVAWNLQERLGQPEHRDAVVEVLRRRAGDALSLIALSEVCREIPVPVTETREYLADFAKQEGYELFWTDYNDAEHRAGHPDTLSQNSAVLSRLPASGGPVRLASRNAIAVTVRYEGERTHFTGAHFDDRSEQTRLRQASAYRSQLPEGPAILAGDLNTMHRGDQRARFLRNPAVGAALGHLPGKPGSFGRRLHEMARGDAMAALTAGDVLFDADDNHTPTMLFAGRIAVAQLDHIMHTPHLRPTHFSIHENGPSDHRLIQADFAW